HQCQPALVALPAQRLRRRQARRRRADDRDLIHVVEDRWMYVGIDIGTSASKGVLIAADGTVRHRASRPHTVSTPAPGWFERAAEDVWWRDFVEIARELVRPAILYGVDTRATVEISELTDLFGGEEILRRGGSPLTSQAVGPKLRWLAVNEPQVWA